MVLIVTKTMGMPLDLEHRALSTVMRCFWEDVGVSGPFRLRAAAYWPHEKQPLPQELSS